MFWLGCHGNKAGRRLSAAHVVSGKASVGRAVGGCVLRECTLKLGGGGAFNCPAKVGECKVIQSSGARLQFFL